MNQYLCKTRVPQFTRGVATRNSVWDQNSVITVSFKGGTEKQRDLVRTISAQWDRYINLRFQFVPSNGMIRVSFKEGGSWSFVGKNALLIPQDDVTCNFGWLHDDMEYDDEAAVAVILHEWGHILGFEHEHNHPHKTIPYNVEGVYSYYSGIGWTNEQITQWVLGSYAEQDTVVSRYDKESIMHYPVDNKLTDGDWSVSWVTSLSLGDKLFASQLYPPDSRIAQVMRRVNFRKTVGYVDKTVDDVYEVIPVGETLKILGGPVVRNGLTWYKTKRLIEVEGWVAEKVGLTTLIDFV